MCQVLVFQATHHRNNRDPPLSPLSPSNYASPFVPLYLQAVPEDSSSSRRLSLSFLLLRLSLCLCSFVCMCDFFTCAYVCTRDPSPTEMSVEPWACPQDQTTSEQAQSIQPSQDQEQHLDKLCLDSFWSEVETIRQGSGDTDLDCTRRDSRQSEGKHCYSDAFRFRMDRNESLCVGVIRTSLRSCCLDFPQLSMKRCICHGNISGFSHAAK